MSLGWTPETDGCDPDERAELERQLREADALRGHGQPLYLGAPIPKPHPLIGRVDSLCMEIIERILDNYPPTQHEADLIARENLGSKRERSDDYRALSWYIEPWRRT